MEQKQLRIQKLSKISYTLLTILRIFCYVGIGLLVSGFIMLAALPENATLFRIAGQDINLLSPVVYEETLSLGGALGKIAEAITSLALLSMALWYAAKIFKATRTTLSPFVPENVRNLKRTALFLLLSALVPATVGGIVAGILNAGFESDMNIVLAVCALVLLWLAFVFDYGAELQTASDETL